jgi:phage shock protein A
MGIFDRMSQLIRANVNDILDRAEDPEKMLNQLIRDMEDSIQNARQQVAAMIVQEKELEADANQTKMLAAEWGKKAERAVAAGKDDLAREALRRKRDNDENSRVYGEQLGLQQQTVERLKQQLRQLESKYQATLSQRDALIARQRRAQAQHQVATAASATVLNPLDPAADLERMERKIRQTEAQAAAALEMGQDDSLEAQFRELDADDDIEAELALLKANVAGELPATASSTTEHQG